MLFSQIIHWLICAIQLINIDTVSENKIETSGVVFVLPAADHRSGRFDQWLTSEPELRKTSYQKNPVVKGEISQKIEFSKKKRKSVPFVTFGSYPPTHILNIFLKSVAKTDLDSPRNANNVTLFFMKACLSLYHLHNVNVPVTL